MHRFYRWQAPIFDWTRWPVLLRRGQLPRFFEPGDRVLEIGCGTGHNLPAVRAAVGAAGSVTGVECAPTMAKRAATRMPEAEIQRTEYGREPVPGGPWDAVVMSYALSMNPDFRRVLDQVRVDLTAGGMLVVLDFVDAPFGWMRRWMQRCGVEPGEARTDCIHSLFEVESVDDFTAWGGLWRYRLLVAHSRERPPLNSAPRKRVLPRGRMLT